MSPPAFILMVVACTILFGVWGYSIYLNAFKRTIADELAEKGKT